MNSSLELALCFSVPKHSVQIQCRQASWVERRKKNLLTKKKPPTFSFLLFAAKLNDKDRRNCAELDNNASLKKMTERAVATSHRGEYEGVEVEGVCGATV